MRKSFKKILSLGLAAAMTIGLGSGIGTLAPANTKKAEAALTYYAAIGFQTSSSWIFRNPVTGSVNTDYNNALEGGKDTKEYHLKEAAKTNQAESTNVITYDYTKHALKAGITTLGGTEYLPGTYDIAATDATLDFNNKEYSIKIEGLDKTNSLAQPLFKNDPDDTGFNMLYISTNIPRTETGATFSDVQLFFDGQLVHTMTKMYPKTDKDPEGKYWMLMLRNNWGNKKQGDKPEDDADKFKYTMPKSSMEIKFKVSGVTTMDTQNPDGTVTSGSSITPPTPTPPAVTSLEKGKTFTAGNFTYKVTKASEESGTATVAVSGVKSSAKKKAALSVPKTVSNEDFKYKVTAVNSKAFANCSKLKTVTLGANVTAIQKNAFLNCKSLNTLKLNSKLKTVAKGSFKGCKQNIKVSGKSKAANVKALKKSGYKKFK